MALHLTGSSTKKMPASCYNLEIAEVTNTRLMGVLGMHLFWTAKSEEEISKVLGEENILSYAMNFHQVFYYEAEESGLETIAEVYGNNETALNEITNRFFGGLGGKKKILEEKEAAYLINFFKSSITLKGKDKEELEKRIILPFGVSTELDRDELDALYRKICVPIETEFGAINYYLMRCIGHDTFGANYLVPKASRENAEMISLPAIGTLRTNNITPFTDSKGVRTFLSESLVETDDAFYVVLSEESVIEDPYRGFAISMAKKKAEFKITDDEAFTKMKRSEYLSVYSVHGESKNIKNLLAEAMPKATRRSCDGGELFMLYHDNNFHVEKPNYSLVDDLCASFFLTDAGQLLLASYTPQGINIAENLIQLCNLNLALDPMGRYNFTHPVLGDFIESGYPDFMDYLHDLV